MSGEARAPSQTAKRLVPRDAATLIVVDRSGADPRILMGRRRPEQDFLPGTFVFPGGRVEATDRAVARTHLPPHARLAGHDEDLLGIAMKGRLSPFRATSLALAAVRETFEETGFIVGEPAADVPRCTGGWRTFHAEGFRPRLDSLAYFARAITPPGRVRRYDTRFFVVDAASVAHRSERADGELLDVGWYTIGAARNLNLPGITRVVIEDLVHWLERPGATLTRDPVPFYVHRSGRFERTFLTRAHSPT
jgi:8-oxo-dGTP pyrophosphatase MutT (NUDIX family)